MSVVTAFADNSEVVIESAAIDSAVILFAAILSAVIAFANILSVVILPVTTRSPSIISA